MEDWKNQGLTILGRLSAIEIALRALIERGGDAEEIRDEIAQVARSAADALLGNGDDLNRATVAFGLIEGAEQITDRDTI